MDIIAVIFSGLGLLVSGVTLGVVLTDRANRKQALTRLEAGEQAVRELVTKIHGTHNSLVEQHAKLAAQVEGLQTRTAAIAAQKAGTTHAQRTPFPKGP